MLDLRHNHSRSTSNSGDTILNYLMHTKADDLADDARAGNRDKALTDLSQLIRKCNACHEKFRH